MSSFRWRRSGPIDNKKVFIVHGHDVSARDEVEQLLWRIGLTPVIMMNEPNKGLTLIEKHSDELHPDHKEIGYRNWQSYEIAKNYEKGNGLVVVKLDSTYSVPSECFGKNAKWVIGFDMDAIKKALNELAY